VRGRERRLPTVLSALTARARFRVFRPLFSYDVFKAMQYCSDIVDTFEGNLGKNNEAGPALKAFLEGERWPKLMGNLERGVQGPYFFGAQPSPVDFFLLQHLDWREQQVFGPLKARHGVDALAPYPKLCGVAAALRAAPAYANYAGGLGFMGPIKDAILDSYHS
jgi:glutathione S-transferase